MAAGTYEDDVTPIPGNILLDRVLGGLCFICSLPILGVAIWRLSHPTPGEPTWVQPAKVVLAVLGTVGIGAIITSRLAFIRVALWLHVVRLLALFAMYPWSGQMRFWGTELIWNLAVIGYCYLRLRSETSRQVE